MSPLIKAPRSYYYVLLGFASVRSHATFGSDTIINCIVLWHTYRTRFSVYYLGRCEVYGIILAYILPTRMVFEILLNITLTQPQIPGLNVGIMPMPLRLGQAAFLLTWMQAVILVHNPSNLLIPALPSSSSSFSSSSSQARLSASVQPAPPAATLPRPISLELV